MDNPKNIKVGDTVYIEQAWEDDAGNYADEYAEVLEIDPEGRMKLKFERDDITEFLSTAEHFVKDYEPYLPPTLK